MKNQQKRGVEPEIIPASAPVETSVADSLPIKPKRGRPKTSPHDTATQNRVRVQRYRNAKKEGEEVQIEIYLPKAWHDWLVHTKNANLREVAVEAFALWLDKQGFPTGTAERTKAAENV